MRHLNVFSNASQHSAVRGCKFAHSEKGPYFRIPVFAAGISKLTVSDVSVTKDDSSIIQQSRQACHLGQHSPAWDVFGPNFPKVHSGKFIVSPRKTCPEFDYLGVGRVRVGCGFKKEHSAVSECDGDIQLPKPILATKGCLQLHCMPVLPRCDSCRSGNSQHAEHGLCPSSPLCLGKTREPVSNPKETKLFSRHFRLRPSLPRMVAR